MEQIVILSDVHLNEDDPVHPSYLAVKNFIKATKPSKIVINGDFIDLAQISHWNKDFPRLVEGKRVKKETDSAIREITYLNKYCKDIIFLAGNHCTRMDKFLNSNPVLEGLIDLKVLLRLDEFDIPYYPETEQPVKLLDGLFVTHGVKTGVNYTRQLALQYKDSLICGHTHRSQSYVTSYSYQGRYPAFQEVYGSGCLCDIYQNFHGQANFGHSNGLVIVEYDDKGWFVHNIVIKNGEFIFGGKKYTSEK